MLNLLGDEGAGVQPRVFKRLKNVSSLVMMMDTTLLENMAKPGLAATAENLKNMRP